MCADPTCPEAETTRRILADIERGDEHPNPPGWPSEEAIDRAAQNAPDVHALVSEDGEREAERRWEDHLIRRLG